MRARVAFVCQWYPPEPAEIPAGIVAALGDQGLDVEVLTGIPNYPSGKVHEGYRAGSRSTEEHAGVAVHRTPLHPSHDSSARGRLMNYASWALSSAALGQRLLRRSDVALVYSSPATAALPAMVSRLVWGKPYVLLVQDVWPDSIFASGFLTGRASRLVERAVDVFVRRAYAMASHVAVISPGMIDLLSSRGVPAEKLSLVYNWLPDAELAVTDDDDTVEGVRARLGIPAAESVFLYAGNHGKAQALEPLVDAFVEPVTEPSHLVLVGSGVSKADLVARASGSDRVHFLDAVPRAEAARLTASADFHVVSLADEPLFAVTMPSKVQSGLAAGRPMLVVSRGDSAELVSTGGAGRGAQPGSATAIAAAVVDLAARGPQAREDMGRRGRELYGRLMAREVGAARLAELLRSAAGDSRRRGPFRSTTPTTQRRETQ
ncbi:glycosyltransferase family 4 protein [Nocardioides dongxiaopingii]|uniref:glycosyltransferase family 4 protein n=1 Tax=Nocardioides sp. S-1144 TaxID=2582905 RepID=UPI00110EBEDC|nr:glycosyltransferase family 4 protein [Nocardioides sp. S-1144]QCW50989.1 glycosyltransferase family 4 protein [Nocardioides sp. S-1144]